MNQELPRGVFGSPGEAADLRCSDSASPLVCISDSRDGESVLLKQETSSMASSVSPSHRPCSFESPPKKYANVPLFRLSSGEVLTPSAATMMTCGVGSAAANAAVGTPITTTPTPTTREGSSCTMSSHSLVPCPSSSSSLCLLSSCALPASSSSSLATTTGSLLRSLCCRHCSSGASPHRCHPLPPPPHHHPPSHPPAAETSKASERRCLPQQQQHLHSWQKKEKQHHRQLPAASCRSVARHTGGSLCRNSSRRQTSRRLRFPLLLQLPAITLTTALALLLLFLPHGIQQAAAQLKFAALGNWGFESGSQQQVADTLKQVARTEHLSFLVSPGSNFAGGVSGPADPKWRHLFEDVYSDPAAALKMPFFTVLGAEDWSGDYTAEAMRTEVAYSPTGTYTSTAAPNTTAAAEETPAQEAEKEEESGATGAEIAAARETQIAETFPKWTMPNWWFHYLMHFPASTGSAFINSGHKDMSVGMVFLDTWILSSSFPFADIRSKAWEDAEKTLALAPKLLDYIIVVTDRPVYSSGSSKGDSALQYYLLPLLEKADIDMLISGYDFSQEVLVHKGITYVNCGAGSFGVGSSMVKDRGSLYYSGQSGFCLFELQADGIVTRLVDGTTGKDLYVYKQPLKKRPERKSIDAFKFVSQLPEVKYWPVPSMGKLPGRDVFVRVVGTIGLCIATFFASLSVASLVSRYTK